MIDALLLGATYVAFIVGFGFILSCPIIVFLVLRGDNDESGGID